MGSGNADLHRFDHETRVLIGGYPGDLVGQRIRLIVRAIACKLQDEAFAFLPDVSSEGPRGLVRAARKLPKIPDRSRRTDMHRDRGMQILRKVLVRHLFREPSYAFG
jgi:hypothetical protein